MVGAIFWCGATYSRMGRIEEDIKRLLGRLEALSHLEAMRAAIETHSAEIVMLRKTVYGDRWRQFGGAGKMTGDS